MAHEELKQRQSVMWGNAPFVSIADTITDLHRDVAGALAPSHGEDALDLGCGTGGVAELIAGSGARIVGVDLAPGLVEIAQERARERGLDIDYRVGDCEDLEFDDASFDAVGSSVGIMFSPDHAASAAELARVTKPGGRIALANWQPGSPGVQDLFKLMGPFQPAPPPSSPFDWGDESKVHALLDDAFELEIIERMNVVRYPSGEDYWQDFSDNYGPTKTLVDSLGDRAGELHDSWMAFFGDAPMEQKRPYILVTGTRR
jgi:SAM-dependent methyltransferase